MAPSATPGGSPGASASSTSSQSAAPPSPLKAARRPAPFSTSFLSLVSATLGGPSVDEFGVGARVWVAHADGSATSATVLAAPQPRSGRCVVREDGRAPAQYHASQLSAAAPARRDDRWHRALAEGDRCLLRSASEGDAPQPCVVVSRPNGQGRCVVRVARGYAGGADRACRLVHAGQLELVDGSFLDDVSRELAPGLLFGECRAYPEAAAKDAADATEDCKEAPPPRYAPADDPDYGPYYRMLKLPLDFHAAVGEDSIWADVHALNGIEVHRPELEKLFVKAAADKKDAPTARKAVKKVKDGARVVVLNRRSTNAAIALSGSKLTALAPAVVAAALERLDAAAFTRTQLDALDAAAPQADEVASLEKCAAGDDDFGRYAEAERFMCRVALPMGARLYADRVAALRYRGGFDDRAAALRGAASRLRAGCAEVTASPSLKKLLTYVLRLSSELADAKRFEFGSPGGAGADGGDDRAGAAGFKMASLLKLADTKAFDRETSALEYLVGLMMRNGDDDALAFADELPGWPPRARRRHAAQELQSLKFGLAKVDALRRSGDEPAADGPEAAAAAAAGALARRAAAAAGGRRWRRRALPRHGVERAPGAGVDVEAAAEAFLDTLAYFHEDGGQTPAEFFSTLVAFAAKFAEAKQRLALRERVDRRRERAEESRVSRSSTIQEKLRRARRASAAEPDGAARATAKKRCSSANALHAAAIEAMLLSRRADTPPPLPPAAPLSPIAASDVGSDGGATPKGRKTVEAPFSEGAATPFSDCAAAPFSEGAATPFSDCAAATPTHSAVESEFSCDDEDLAELRDLALY
ncbi:hypothetical protein JL722_13495 [Aureococcus anophagefferens]|nr:hypothetical protein JL722_13495 [Aureococcus anophagefferens]